VLSAFSFVSDIHFNFESTSCGDKQHHGDHIRLRFQPSLPVIYPTISDNMHFSGPQQRSTYTLLFVVVLCGILWTGYFLGTEHHDVGISQLRRPSSSHHPSRPVQGTGIPPGFPYTHAIDVTVPAGVKVIGLVFFGRRELVQVLDCYLKVRNSFSMVLTTLIFLERGTLKNMEDSWMKSYGLSILKRKMIWRISKI